MIYSNGAWQYEFDYKDHLGNTRVSFKAENGTLIQTARTDFDPWGVVLKSSQANTFSNRFEYQGKETEKTFGLNRISLGARSYNPTIGRMDNVDPLADHPNQVGISPYAFSNNNPVNLIDPDGRLPIPLITGAIGAAGGLIYGLVKGKSWKETAALTAGGFVAGATLGFGTAGIAALGGIEAIGRAGATMITLGSGVAGGMLGNAAEQGVKISLGESSSFSGNEVVLNGAFGMSEVVLGPAGKAAEGAAKNAVQDGLSQMFKPASRAEIRSTQRELASQIRSSALPGAISKSEAKSAAKQLVTAAQTQRANTLQGTIRISNGAVDVSVNAMQTAASEETKNKLNN